VRQNELPRDVYSISGGPGVQNGCRTLAQPGVCMTRTGPYFSPRRELGPQPRPPRTVGGTASASEPPRRRQGSGGRGRRRPGPARRRCQCQAASAAAARPGPGHCPRTPGRHRLRPVPGGNLGKQNSTKFSAGGPLQPTTKTHYQLVPATNVSKRAVVLISKKRPRTDFLWKQGAVDRWCTGSSAQAGALLAIRGLRGAPADERV